MAEWQLVTNELGLVSGQMQCNLGKIHFVISKGSWLPYWWHNSPSPLGGGPMDSDGPGLLELPIIPYLLVQV